MYNNKLIRSSDLVYHHRHALGTTQMGACGKSNYERDTSMVSYILILALLPVT